MNRQEKILRNGFTAFSLITSFLFVYYAVSIFNSGGASDWLKTFAYVTGGYGLMNVYILSWAWRAKSRRAGSANIVIACCFFGVVLMDLFRGGIQGGQQLAVIIGLAGVLAVNWLAIKKICDQPD